jgi:hypothetical protein
MIALPRADADEAKRERQGRGNLIMDGWIDGWIECKVEKYMVNVVGF